MSNNSQSTAANDAQVGVINQSMVGQVLNNKYRLIDVIASGGMGKVYKAEQLPLGRSVALKVLHPQLAVDADPEELQAFTTRFLREASILSKLQHSNIVTVFDYGLIDGQTDSYFMVMEYLDGMTLARRLRLVPPLSLEQTLAAFEQIARGLQKAHKQGVIHRDLKPANIMLVREDESTDKVKILDFGLVKLLEDHGPDVGAITSTGVVMGSPKYISPEQVNPGSVLDQRCDIYSFGVMLFETICWEHPFQGDNALQLMLAHAHAKPPLLTDVVSDPLPAALVELVRRCLEKDPKARPASMDEVITSIRTARTEAGFEANSPGSISGSLSVLRDQIGLDHPSGRPSSPSISGSGPRRAQSLGETSNSSITKTDVRRSGGHRAVSSSGRLIATGAAKSGDISRLSLPDGDIDPNGLTELSRSRTSGNTNDAPINEPAKVSQAHQLHMTFTAVLALVVIVGGGYLIATRGQHSQVQPQVLVPSATSNSRYFSYRIETSPAGAQIHDGAKLVGVTPWQTTLDNEELQKTPKLFSIHLDKYHTETLIQGPSGEAIKQTIVLTADKADDVMPTASASAGNAAPSASAPTKPVPQTGPKQEPKTPVGSDPGIRLSR